MLEKNAVARSSPVRRITWRGEHATLMEIPQAVFAGYYNGSAHAALKFQQAINQELLQALARTNNHLTRLISQARIRNHGQHVDTLGHALLGQDYRLGMA